MIGHSTPKATLKMESVFASNKELGKATPLKVFRVGGSPSPPINCATMKPSSNLSDMGLSEELMIQQGTTIEERPNESQRMNIDSELNKTSLKEIPNCPFEDGGKVGPSIVIVCDSILRAPLKRIDPSLWPRKKNSTKEGSSQEHSVPLANEGDSLDHEADDMIFDDGGNIFVAP